MIRDLRLAEHGLSIIARPFANFLPLPDGGYLKVGGGLAATQAEVAKHSRRDAQRLPEYYAMLDRVADVLRDLVLATPPNDPRGGGLARCSTRGRSRKRFRALDLAGRRDLLDLFTKSAGDVLDRWFESGADQGGVRIRLRSGQFREPVYARLRLCAAASRVRRGERQAGPMGPRARRHGFDHAAMAAECAARGVTLRTDAAVARVIIAAGRATGVELASGEIVRARRVVANVNPKLLFLKLVAPEHLPADFLGRIGGYRCGSGTFRMNVALSELPDFTALPGKNALPHHASGIVVAPSLAYMERAYFDAKTSGWSAAPIVEMLLPSVVDDLLAPAGMHVASLFCQHVHPDLPSVMPGRGWDDARDEVADLMIETVNRVAPNFKASVLGRRALTPLDLEREFGLTGGDIFHGALSLDQLFSARPVLGHGDYRAPIRGLYLCGAGAHPGGGVTGAPGHNAAREILKDARRRRF